MTDTKTTEMTDIKTAEMTAIEFARIVATAHADITVAARNSLGVEPYSKEDAKWLVYLVSTGRKFKAGERPCVMTDARTHEAAIVMDEENKRQFMEGFRDAGGRLDVERSAPLCMPWLDEKIPFHVDTVAADETTCIDLRACDLTDCGGLMGVNAYNLGWMWARRNEKIMAA